MGWRLSRKYLPAFHWILWLLLLGLKSLLNQVIESDVRGHGHSEGQTNSQGRRHAPFHVQTYLLERMKILEVKFIEIVQSDIFNSLVSAEHLYNLSVLFMRIPNL